MFFDLYTSSVRPNPKNLFFVFGNPTAKVTPSPTGEGLFVGEGVLDIPLCSVCFNKTDDHWSSPQVAVHLCVIPHVSPYMSFAGRRGAVPYKKIEQLCVIMSEVATFVCAFHARHSFHHQRWSPSLGDGGIQKRTAQGSPFVCKIVWLN